MVLEPKELSPDPPGEFTQGIEHILAEDKVFEAYSRKTSPDFVSRTSLLARSKEAQG